MAAIDRLLEIMAALRHPTDGCPWDREQSFQSLSSFTLEEAYEVADAIARQDDDDLRDELGDLLFQVVFYSRIAEESGIFDFDDVATAISDKLTRRHPHVFGSAAQRAAGQTPGSWEDIKAAERAAARSEQAPPSALDGVARALPALKRAAKLGDRAARVGFDWPDAEGVRAKVAEELAELDAAWHQADAAGIEEELGDLLFSLVNFGRHLGVDAEQALAVANRKFRQRFVGMEAAAGDRKAELSELSAADWEELWSAQKQRSS